MEIYTYILILQQTGSVAIAVGPFWIFHITSTWRNYSSQILLLEKKNIQHITLTHRIRAFICYFNSNCVRNVERVPFLIHIVINVRRDTFCARIILFPPNSTCPTKWSMDRKNPMIPQFAPRNYFIYLCEFKSTVERLSECVGPPQADKSDWHILKFISSKFIFSLRTCWWYVDVIASSLPRLFMQSMYHFSIGPESRSSVPNDISSQKLYWIKYAETKCHNFKCDYLSSASGPIRYPPLYHKYHEVDVYAVCAAKYEFTRRGVNGKCLA